MKNLSSLQKWANVYFVLFFVIFSLNYIPIIHDSQGQMFGLFKLDLIDDFVHLISAIWAAFSAQHSEFRSRQYFRLFGAFYLLDGLVCFIFKQCILDLSIISHCSEIQFVSGASFYTRMLINGPHILIGSIALILGFIWNRK